MGVIAFVHKSGDMVQSSSKLKSLLASAASQEAGFDWRAASRTYAQVISLVSAEEPLLLGKVAESRSYASYRYAFQAETREEFLGRIADAVKHYSKAKEAYKKLDRNSSIPWTRRCDAMTAFLKFWQVGDPAERRRLIATSWSAAKDSMNAFEDAHNHSELRRTCNVLSYVVSIGFGYAAEYEPKKTYVKEGLEYSEKTVEYPGDGEDSKQYATALMNASYYNRLYCSECVDAEHRREWDSRSGELWRKALAVSKEGALDAITFLQKWGVLPSTLTWEEAVQIRREADEYAAKTRDLLRSAQMAEWRTTGALLDAHDATDPETRDRFIDEALRLSEKSRQCYDIASSIYLSEGAFWSGAPESAYYAVKASLETDLTKKREAALKGLKANEDGIKLAEECDLPEAIASMHDDATKIHFSLARTETDAESKRKALERAQYHGMRLWEIWSTLHPFDYGVVNSKAYMAEIKRELAEVASDVREKARLLREAISLIKEAYEGLEKEGEVTGVAIQRWCRLMLGVYLYQRGMWSLELHELSKDRKDLEVAAEAFRMAVEHAQSAEQPSRAAECSWKAAQTQDALGDYLGASERFVAASEFYRQAAEMIPSLMGLYLENSSYMQAWDEIEKAAYHHLRQEREASKEHYRNAARLHESTDRWRFLSGNYLAWAHVEDAEDLSQKEKLGESVEAFKEAARLFKDSQGKMRDRIQRIADGDEKRMVEGLIGAADNRARFCNARIALEEARLLDRNGDSGSASLKYGQAADMFTKINEAVTAEQDKKEIELIVTLSKAWKAMAKAEAEASPEGYAEAAHLFEAAMDLSPGEKAKALAQGHSRFCKALEAGTRFADSRNVALHAQAVKHLDSAANHYARAGAENASEYSRASRLLLDAYGLMDKAGHEADQEKKAKAYLAVERILEASSESFGKAQAPGKRDQVLKLLESVSREREFAVSLTKILHAPLGVSSSPIIAIPSPTYERPVGMEQFEHADIQANLVAPKKNLTMSETLKVEIELVNAGRGPAQLVKLQDPVPAGFMLIEESSGYQMEDSYLNLRGKRLDPLKTEGIKLVLKPSAEGQFALKPRILYLDQDGKYKSHEPEPIRVTVGAEAAASYGGAFATDTHEAAEARMLLANLRVVTLSHYRIVGNYVRYGGLVCNSLKDARQKILAACQSTSGKRENYIIWAPPGSGKTYFVQEVAALLGDSVHYRELNLAKLDQASFRSGLAELRQQTKPCLCLVDEADAKPEESWPYETLLPFLDASVTAEAQFVFVLAGSTGSSLEEMKKEIASRPKGADVLSRIPTGNEYTIPSMGVGDRLLVVLSQFRQAGRQSGREVREVEKLGLYYVALNPRLTNARQLREFAVRCAERVLPGDDRLKYDNLFHPGDRENKLFWTEALQSANTLVDSFLLVED